VGRGVVRLGQIGYIFKRVAFAIVGGLFGWAAITYDLEKAGGLDDALRTVNRAPFGAGPVTLNGARPGLLRHLLLCLGQAPEGPTDTDKPQQVRRCGCPNGGRSPGMTS